MNGFWNGYDWLLDKLKIIGAISLVGMTALTCADVVGRFFKHPVYGSVELVGMMATLSIAMALAYTHKEKGHIGVELLVRLFSEKVQTMIGLCTSVVSMILLAIITWRMALYAHTMQKSGEVSMLLELPEYLVIYVLAFCFFMFFLLLFHDVLDYIGLLIKKYSDTSRNIIKKGVYVFFLVLIFFLWYFSKEIISSLNSNFSIQNFESINPTLAGIIGIIIMLVIFMTRMPVAYVMALIGFVGFGFLISYKGGLNLLSRNIYDAFSSYGLTTIPLFVLMGQIAFNCGISRKLYDTAYKFLGNIQGGLAMTTVSACTAFGAVCGSSPATAATMATVGLPEMKRYGYADELSSGSVASGGGLGMIMPPSVVLIVYGVLTEQSIGKLFVSGILPAILMTILFIISIYIWCLFKPDQGPKGEKFTLKQKIKSLTGMIDTLAVFILVMGGLFIGLFTPTEAAAVGVFGVVAVSLIRKQITWKAFVKSLYETLRTSCMVMFLIAGAVVFGKFLAVSRIPFDIANWIGGFDLPPFLIMAIIVLVYFIGGCVMDALALIMLTIPIFFQVVLNLGYDPIWFGVIIVLVTQMGVITPPVGINVYVVYGVSQASKDPVSLEAIFKGIVPFLFAIVVGIILMVLFPQIILFLPNLMF